MIDFTERIKNLEEYNPEFIFKEGAFRLSVQFKKIGNRFYLKIRMLLDTNMMRQ